MHSESSESRDSLGVSQLPNALLNTRETTTVIAFTLFLHWPLPRFSQFFSLAFLFVNLIN